MNNQEIKKSKRGEKFIQYIVRMIASNTGKAAALRRADNPALEYQSWEILNRFGIDLTRKRERLAFCLIASGVAKAKIKEDGILGIGAAIAHCYEKKSESDQASTKLRRLIASNSVEELCSVLRPLLQLILSKNGTTLCYGRLLDELLEFQFDPLKIKAKWAQDFYSQNIIGEDDRVC